jgi:hypothetical protein
MENDESKKKQAETSNNLASGSATVSADSQTGRAKDSKKKSASNKKWSLRRHWRQAKWPKRLKWIAEGVGILIALSVPSIYVWDHIQRGTQFSMEHRPRVSPNRPPQLVGQLTCLINDKELITHANIRVWLKNTKTGDATGVFPFAGPLKSIPVKRTGLAVFDEIITPPISAQTCKLPPFPKTQLFALNGGQEIGIDLGASEVHGLIGPSGKPAIPVDSTFQIYFPVCAYYVDEELNKHGTCATFRFSTNGKSVIACDGSPLSGTFEQIFSGYCED